MVQGAVPQQFDAPLQYPQARAIAFRSRIALRHPEIPFGVPLRLRHGQILPYLFLPSLGCRVSSSYNWEARIVHSGGVESNMHEAGAGNPLN
jgi:hypothetical protein